MADAPFNWDRSDLRNTIETMTAHAATARALTRSLQSGKSSLVTAEGEVAKLKREFEYDRLAFESFKKSAAESGRQPFLAGEGYFDYLIATAYASEIPVLIAWTIACLRAQSTDRDSYWARVKAEELLTVNDLIDKASSRLTEFRRKMGFFRRRITVIKIAWANRKLSRSSAGPPAGTWVPLGYGDLKFIMSCASAAVSQLSFSHDRASFLFDGEPVDSVRDHSDALGRAELFLPKLFTSDSTELFEGPLPNLTLAALVVSESTVGRHRLSRTATLHKARIYALRAAACLMYARAAKRAETTPCEIHPEEMRRHLVSEQKIVLREARSLINTSRDLAREAKSFALWRHDLAWAFFNADLTVDMGDFAVLKSQDLRGIRTLADLLSDTIDKADRAVAMGAQKV